jgi:HAD superfamily hydrolase (TIGR01490 family)
MTLAAAQVLRSATFFDFDGTLADTNLVHVYAFYARHAGRRSELLSRHARLLANVPAFYALDAYSRVRFARHLYSMYRGMSRDRLEHFSRRLFDEVLLPRVHSHTADLLDAARAKGPIVLVTGAADFSVRHFAEHFRFDGVIATRLEFRDGLATGGILPPEVFGANKARAMREYAREHGIDLGISAAYADGIADVSMLEAVGRAGVVNPNVRLAQLARDYQWQILRM